MHDPLDCYISLQRFSLYVHCVLQPQGTNTYNKGHKLTVFGQTMVHKICILSHQTVHR